MDVADISPGLDFRQATDDNVASCGVLLAVIGPQWVTATDRSGKRRIDDDSDFVRLKTALALARKIPVIPVLVHGATMPATGSICRMSSQPARMTFSRLRIRHVGWIRRNTSQPHRTGSSVVLCGASVDADKLSE